MRERVRGERGKNGEGRQRRVDPGNEELGREAEPKGATVPAMMQPESGLRTGGGGQERKEKGRSANREMMLLLMLMPPPMMMMMI